MVKSARQMRRVEQCPGHDGGADGGQGPSPKVWQWMVEVLEMSAEEKEHEVLKGSGESDGGGDLRWRRKNDQTRKLNALK